MGRLDQVGWEKGRGQPDAGHGLKEGVAGSQDEPGLGSGGGAGLGLPRSQRAGGGERGSCPWTRPGPATCKARGHVCTGEARACSPPELHPRHGAGGGWSLACLGPCCAPCLSPFLAWTLAGSRPSPPLLRWCQAPWWGVGFLAVVAPLPAPLSPGRILLPAVAAAASLPSGGSELPRRHFHLLTRNPRSRPWAHMGRGLWGRSLAPLSRRRWLC